MKRLVWAVVLCGFALYALPGSAPGMGSCLNEQVRAEAHSTYLPDCRAYELVTPPYKEGYPVVTTNIAPAGSRVIGQSFGAFAGAEDVPKGAGLIGASYEFSRTGLGWTPVPLTPSATVFAEDFSGNAGQLVSSDFGTTTWVLNGMSQPPLERALYLRKPDGSLILAGPMTPPAATALDDNFLMGASRDLSHVLFLLEYNRWPGDTTKPGPSLYEIVGTGNSEPKLVGVSNQGPLASNTEATLVSNCGTKLGSTENQGESHSAVSADGETVYFTAVECEGAPPTNELYARIGGAKTIAISEPSLSVPGRNCTGTCKAAEEEPSLRREGVFRGASEDGSKVYFTTTQPLVDGDTDATNDLYLAEVTSLGVRSLVQVSHGDSTDPTPGSGANVLSVPAVASDGSRAYFVAEGVLTTTKNRSGQEAVPSAPNLYMVEPASGNTKFIMTLSSSETESTGLTPNGRFLVFGNAGQLFEYDSASGALTTIGSEQLGAYVSDDGAYVFFSSTASLTPRAAAGISNVYEYHDGQVSLIVDGARLIGADALGGNVFFETLNQRVSQDTDTQVDVYDARIGGGFPAAVSPVGCSGDGCQGPSAAAPPVFGPPGSVTFNGPGNLAPTPSLRVPSAKPKPPSRAEKRAKALKACRNKHSHARKLRERCERQARKRYRAKTAKNETHR